MKVRNIIDYPRRGKPKPKPKPKPRQVTTKAWAITVLPPHAPWRDECLVRVDNVRDDAITDVLITMVGSAEEYEKVKWKRDKLWRDARAKGYRLRRVTLMWEQS